MIKIALVGGIGSGKSYLAKLFNYPIFDADLEVARIYKKDKNFFINLKKKLNDYSFSFPVKKS
jgi:dephospho-CoA kinase